MSLRTQLSSARRSVDPGGTRRKAGFPARRVAVCGAVLVASAVLAGTSASAADASSHGRPLTTAGHALPGLGYAVGHTTAISGATVADVPATSRAAAISPDATPPDSQCQGQGPGHYGWFGITPGSSADGGISNDLWLDAKGDVVNTPVQVYTGNGGANQQWCEMDAGDGDFKFYADYNSSAWQCLTVNGGYGNDYAPGLSVYAANCADSFDQDWYVCPRSGSPDNFSLEPAFATPSSAWLDVRGGTSDNGKSAFVPMSPLQIWTGNGQDNQRFTLYPSPGEPNVMSYSSTSGLPGC
jgi:hypothetical protein